MQQRESEPAAPFDPKSCILCDHVIVQQVLGNKCEQSGSLCCYMRSCPEEDRKRREAAKEARENPCEENGCTDIESCDEICQHSRIYSPVQMQQAIAQATAAENKRVLDLIIKEAQTAREENRKIGRATIDDAGKEYRRGCAVGNKEIGEYAESLRSEVKKR
jgi:hypothetical protein